jgi:hypothetical protein
LARVYVRIFYTPLGFAPPENHLSSNLQVVIHHGMFLACTLARNVEHFAVFSNIHAAPHQEDLMMKKRLLSFVGLSIFLVQSASASLVNPGFETGNFDGWTVAGSNGGSGVGVDGIALPSDPPFPPNNLNVRSGNYSAYALVASTAGEFLSLSQTVNLQAGTQTAGFFMSLDAASGMGINQAILGDLLAIFVEGIVQPFTTRFPDNNFPTGSTPADFYEFSSDFAASGGPTLIEFRISGSGTSRAGISVDDFFVTGGAVPEPSIIALIGLGLAGIGYQRRRKAA